MKSAIAGRGTDFVHFDTNSSCEFAASPVGPADSYPYGCGSHVSLIHLIVRSK